MNNETVMEQTSQMTFLKGRLEIKDRLERKVKLLSLKTYWVDFKKYSKHGN